MQRLALCCLLILTTVSSVAAEPMPLSVNGQARTFVLHRPAGQGPHPTIIMLHSGGGGAEEELRSSGLAQLGPQDGFLAVFPEAMGGLWNFFPPGKETTQYVRVFSTPWRAARRRRVSQGARFGPRAGWNVRPETDLPRGPITGWRDGAAAGMCRC